MLTIRFDSRFRSAKLADGIVTVAAAAAVRNAQTFKSKRRFALTYACSVCVVSVSQPPPPPGEKMESSFFDPAKNPPPPPSVKQHAYSIFIRETIIPYTEAICDGKVAEGSLHKSVCTQLLDKLATFQFIQAVGTVAPICSELCWHSCDGTHIGGQDDDSFSNCQQTQCARTVCKEFLLRECSPILHQQIETKYKMACEIVPPSPPYPPAPPPRPPQPPHSPAPHAPPPAVKYVERLRETEQESDADCGLVSYATCLEVVRQFAQRMGPGYSSKLRVTTTGCEGIEVETDCFLGCSYGNRGGGQYRFLPESSPELYYKHTRPRCRLSDHPRCACDASQVSPPPIAFAPPPPRTYTEDFEIVNPREPRDSSRGAIGAMVQRVVNGRTLDLSLRSGKAHFYECPGDDDGRDTCALTCATHHLSRLRAFAVTGERCGFWHSNHPSTPARS
jgi:hypothetical protein